MYLQTRRRSALVAALLKVAAVFGVATFQQAPITIVRDCDVTSLDFVFLVVVLLVLGLRVGLFGYGGGVRMSVAKIRFRAMRVATSVFLGGLLARKSARKLRTPSVNGGPDMVRSPKALGVARKWFSLCGIAAAIAFCLVQCSLMNSSVEVQSISLGLGRS